MAKSAHLVPVDGPLHVCDSASLTRTVPSLLPKRMALFAAIVTPPAPSVTVPLESAHGPVMLDADVTFVASKVQE